jgi:hypothetical protein
VLQVSDPVSAGIKETTGTHAFGKEMNAIFCGLTKEMDRSILEVLGRYSVGQIAERVHACRENKGDEIGNLSS